MATPRPNIFCTHTLKHSIYLAKVILNTHISDKSYTKYQPFILVNGRDTRKSCAKHPRKWVFGSTSTDRTRSVVLLRIQLKFTV